jgi:hypothetical protein
MAAITSSSGTPAAASQRPNRAPIGNGVRTEAFAPEAATRVERVANRSVVERELRKVLRPVNCAPDLPLLILQVKAQKIADRCIRRGDLPVVDLFATLV